MDRSSEWTPLTQRLAKTIRYYRLEQGIGQAELARRVGTNAVRIGYIENMYTGRISTELLRRLEEQLGFDASKLEEELSLPYLMAAARKTKSITTVGGSPNRDEYHAVVQYLTNELGYIQDEQDGYIMRDRFGRKIVWDIQHPKTERPYHTHRAVIAAIGTAAMKRGIGEYLLVLPVECERFCEEFYDGCPNLSIEFSIVFYSKEQGGVIGRCRL